MKNQVRWCSYGCGFHCDSLKKLEAHAVEVHGATPEQFKPQQLGRQMEMFNAKEQDAPR